MVAVSSRYGAKSSDELTMARIAIVYEISQNPLFESVGESNADRLTEFAQPSEIDSIVSTLKDLGHSIGVIDGPFDLLQRAEDVRAEFDLVFNKSLGFKGIERKIHVPSICLLYGIPMLGSSAYSMTLARHKFHTNRLLAGLGYRVPGAVLMTGQNPPCLESLRLPLIVKPNQESDAVGISTDSVVNGHIEAIARARWIVKTFNQPAIIEEFIGGEEWKIPVLGNLEMAQAMGNVGVMRNGEPILGSLQTRQDLLERRLRHYAVPDNEASAEAKSLAEAVHRDLGLADYSRCDFRLDDEGQVYCLEVSTHPELNRHSSFIAGASIGGQSYSEILESIVRTALLRHADSP